MQDFLEGRLSCPPHTGPSPEADPGFTGMDAPQPPRAAPAPAPHSHTRPVPGGTPDIQLVKEDGQIRKIIVLCSCGERIELECAY